METYVYQKQDIL